MQEAGSMNLTYDILSFDHLFLTLSLSCHQNSNAQPQPSMLLPSEGEALFLAPQPLEVGPYTVKSCLPALPFRSSPLQSFPTGDLLNPMIGSSTASFEPSISAEIPNMYYHERRTLAVEVVGYSYDPQIYYKPQVLQVSQVVLSINQLFF